MIELTADKKKTCSVKDIFNNKGVKNVEKEEINFKTIDLNNENDIYVWSEYWERKRFEK